MKSRMALEARQVAFGYRGNGLALHGVTFAAAEAEMIALLGANGSGKTTLLKLLLGLLAPAFGTVELFGREPRSYAPRERAKTAAYVSQQQVPGFPMTAAELVALGRYPHGSRGALSEADRDAVEEALQFTGAGDLGRRLFGSLSGGEQQKVLIARALAQSARVLLLDEPTLHLDLYYQLEILAALKRRCAERAITVVTVLHDINLASLFADKALLLKAGWQRGFGPVGEVLNEESVKELLNVEVKAAEGAGGARYFIPSGPFGSSNAR